MGPEPPASRIVRSTSWRYRFIVGLIWIAVLAAAAAGWRYARASGPVFGPIIVVSIDSLRADRLPAYGYAKLRTPALDALAADSVTFERAYSHSPLTLPSHVSMLSGLLPFQSGVRDDVGFPVGEDLGLLPRLLHKRGFKTAGIVSSRLLGKETGLASAFGFFDDEVGDEKGARPLLGVGGEGPANHGQNAATPAGPSTREERGAWPLFRDGADALKVAEHWIDSIGTGRFFLFLHLPGPTDKAGYDAKVAAADELVGQLVAFLKKRGLYNGGILVVTSGHGLGLGDHGEDGHGLYLYEPVMRVPLIVKPPRRDGGGRHSAALVQLVDIAPTVLDLVGAPRPSRAMGRSLRGVLDSPTATLPLRQVYAESFAPRFRFGWSEIQSLTDDRHRYIKAARPELYDVLQDPRERNDLSETETAKAQALSAALDKLTASTAEPQPAPVPDTERDRLAVMGYVTVDLPAPPTPVDPKDHAEVANLYWRASRRAVEGRTAEAIATYQDTVKADKMLAPAWDRLAALLLDTGRLKEAGAALTSLIRLYPEEARAAAAEARLQPLLGTTPPSVDRAVLAASVWTALGEKAKAAEIRSAARKSAGEAAVRKAEAALK
jgi:arylsulfatase A-like enzyme